MDALVTYYPKFFMPAEDFFLDRLSQDLAWVRRDNTPRMEYYVNSLNVPYTYGKGVGQRTYEPQEDHFVIQAIRSGLHIETCIPEGTKFEVCFLNRYLHQREQLGWHADDSPEMDDERPIAIASFGAEREIMFRRKPFDGGEDHRGKPAERLRLGHGSLCVMAPGMQDHWEHRIPKADREVGERISLTFRGYKA